MNSSLGGASSVPLARLAFGGLLMGLANLVPGISGGTMLLAAGGYTVFIGAVSDISSLRWTRKAWTVLFVVAAAAASAILFGAAVVRDAVVAHRWMMYSLFIGLTLGGIPLLWSLAKPARTSFWVMCVVSTIGMIALAFVQASHQGAGTERTGFVFLFLAGTLGAAAMILPGVSGGYLLLLLGAYVPVLNGIAEFKDALQARSLDAILEPAVHVILPVGLGVALGVAAVSSALEVVLRRWPQATIGSLMGLLLGAVFGLWPFQRGIAPELGSTWNDLTVTTATLRNLEPSEFPVEFFPPTTSHVLIAIVLVVTGFVITTLVARISGPAAA